MECFCESVGNIEKNVFGSIYERIPAYMPGIEQLVSAGLQNCQKKKCRGVQLEYLRRKRTVLQKDIRAPAGSVLPAVGWKNQKCGGYNTTYEEMQEKGLHQHGGRFSFCKIQRKFTGPSECHHSQDGTVHQSVGREIEENLPWTITLIWKMAEEHRDTTWEESWILFPGNLEQRLEGWLKKRAENEK